MGRTLSPNWLHVPINIRTVSSKAQKLLVLEKPEKFNPPSHSAKSRKSPSYQYGPQIAIKELDQQSKKRYPNMMPPEGTFMHWFIHNKLIHLWLSLVRRQKLWRKKISAAHCKLGYSYEPGSDSISDQLQE